jgi:thiamine transport system substrate-binding protein
MQSKDFQAALPAANYVYPIVKGIKLPDAWARFAKPADSFVDVSKLDFDANRKAWQKQWLEIVQG